MFCARMLALFADGWAAPGPVVEAGVVEPGTRL
jgi:hypothetical protein